jgi:membrane-bound serine protease (ClpP class)
MNRFRRVAVLLSLAGLVPAGVAIAQDEPDLLGTDVAETRPADPQPSADAPATTSAADSATTRPLDWTDKIIVRRRKVARPPLPGEVTNAFVIPVREQITEVLGKSIERKITQCKASGAEIVIFDMDTPGGRSDVMSEIVTMIREDLREVYTVAFVNPDAFSAGAIISLACDEIIMTPSGVIGDAMPIMAGPGGLQEIPEKERGKFESAMRAEVRTLAKAGGYNELLCEAMITITIEVWLIRNEDTGEYRVVDAAEYAGKVRGVPTGKRKSKTDKAPETPWVYVRELDGSNELITMTAEEARALGFTERILDDLDALEKHFNITFAPTVLTDTWSEHLVGFLTSPAVAGLLFLMMFVFIYMELHTPGFVGFGALAVVCLAVLLGSRYLTGLAQWWEIAIILLGVGLLMAEVFLIPGFGVAGIAGFLLIAIGLLAVVIPNAPDKLPFPETEADWSWFGSGLMALMLGFVGSLVVGGFLSRYLPKTHLVLNTRLILAPNRAPETDAALDETDPVRKVKVGDVGTAESYLRPVGEVRFEAGLIDAVSEGTFIAAGSKVRVLRRDGNRVVVEEVTA